MRSLSSEEARNCFADTLDHVTNGLEHIVINQPDKESVYMIPAKDYELFLKLLQQAEDNLDLKEAEERVTNPEQERVGFDEFFAELYQVHSINQ